MFANYLGNWFANWFGDEEEEPTPRPPGDAGGVAAPYFYFPAQHKPSAIPGASRITTMAVMGAMIR